MCDEEDGLGGHGVVGDKDKAEDEEGYGNGRIIMMIRRKSL
jgi:hypothetical protein